MNVNCSNRDGPGDDHTKRSTSDRETQTMYITERWKLTFIQIHYFPNRNTLTDLENKLMATKGEW